MGVFFSLVVCLFGEGLRVLVDFLYYRFFVTRAAGCVEIREGEFLDRWGLRRLVF